MEATRRTTSAQAGVIRCALIAPVSVVSIRFYSMRLQTWFVSAADSMLGFSGHNLIVFFA
jgi:hypothetical protein